MGSEFYVDALRLLGFADRSGMALTPLTFTEISAGMDWADFNDKKIIREMSVAYCNGIHFTDPLGIAPMDRE